jgi:hypothetical protein
VCGCGGVYGGEGDVRFIKDKDGDLINLDLVASVEFLETSISITYVYGIATNYDKPKEKDAIELFKYNSFKEKLLGLEEK